MTTFKALDTEESVVEFLNQLENKGYNLSTSIISITGTRCGQFIVFYKKLTAR